MESLKITGLSVSQSEMSKRPEAVQMDNYQTRRRAELSLLEKIQRTSLIERKIDVKNGVMGNKTLPLIV